MRIGRTFPTITHTPIIKRIPLVAVAPPAGFAYVQVIIC